MKINKVLKYSLILGISSIIFASCEKAIENSVPDGTPRRDFYNKEVKSYLTNIGPDSIWITQKLDKSASLTLMVAFEFRNDGTAGLYNIPYSTLSVIQQLELAKQTNPAFVSTINQLIGIFTGIDDIQLRSLLITVPGNSDLLSITQIFFPVTLAPPPGKIIITEGSNKYDIIGDFDSSLTFFNSSFLSDLKVRRAFDFDFLIEKYSRDSVELKGYYTQNANREPTIKPIAKSSLAPYFAAVDILRMAPFATAVKIDGQIVPDESASTLRDKFKEYYDNSNKSLAFVVNSGKTLNSLYQNTNALAVIEVPFKVNSAKPAVGTVLAKFKAYKLNTKGGINSGLNVEIVVK